MIRLAIFASGSGSNAEKIMETFQSDPQISVEAVLSNKSDAFVLERAKIFGVTTIVFNRDEFKDKAFLNKLEEHNVDYLILAGFLWKVPDFLIQAFPDRILNIHPSLLPKHGGKGMYGSRVHQAVLDSGDNESGITIHLVNEQYDEGRVLFQAKCEVEKTDSVETLAQKIHALEHKHFPRVIKEFVLS